MAKEKKFLINDESVNRYGYRILSSGIRTENFLKNPVCLISHNGEKLSIGKWKDLQIEGNKFVATLEFDENDPTAMLIYNKYDKGYMSANSLSMLKMKESSIPSLILPGQTKPTVTECELLEISLANVPGNANSIKLLLENGEECKLELIAENQNSNKKKDMTEEQLKAENEQLKNQRALELVATHVTRGAVPEASKGFYENSAMLDYTGTKTALEALPSKEDQNAGKKQLAAQLVEMHQKRGAIDAQQLDFYTKAAEADYEGTKKVLEGMKGTERLSDLVNNLSAEEKAAGDKNDKTKWTYLDWYKKDLEGLQKMETEKPDQYKKLLLETREDLKKEGVYNPSQV